MKLVEKLSQHRRDFKGKYECQNCGHIIINSGYDDDYFHEQVIPKMRCEKCGKTTEELGIKNERMETKYPDGMQV